MLGPNVHLPGSDRRPTLNLSGEAKHSALHDLACLKLRHFLFLHFYPTASMFFCILLRNKPSVEKKHPQSNNSEPKTTWRSFATSFMQGSSGTMPLPPPPPNKPTDTEMGYQKQKHSSKRGRANVNVC